MKHVARDGLIALLAVAALALVGQRRATAGGCKADGAVCRTSRSCCGTSGNNGVCVEESGAKFGVCCTPDCTGKECGDDGCGGSCGTCTAPQTCGGGGTVNVCGCTPRTTCPAGDNCGSVPDGCGGTLNCGTCANGQTCTNNVCGGCTAGKSKVTLSVTGQNGTVTSNPSGLNVSTGNTGSNCFTNNTQIELQATRSANWTGVSCDGGNTDQDKCRFNLGSSAVTITANLL